VQVREQDLGGGRLMVLASVRGLVREAGEVRAAFESFAPEAVVLPVGPRELDEIVETLKEKGELPGPPSARKRKRAAAVGPTGLKDVRRNLAEEESDYDDIGLFVSGGDMVFLRRLSTFGDVEMPPPSFQEAVRLARGKGAAVIAADFDDLAYTEVFIAHVRLRHMFFLARRLRRFEKGKKAATDPEGLARQWDGGALGLKAYRLVEQAREEKVAAGILQAMEGNGRVMALVEVERLAGVTEWLRRMEAARSHRVSGDSEARPSPN